MNDYTPRLRMAGVTKHFGSVQALRSVDLEVLAGEVHGLLGGNGAGKTTLMNVLFGLYRGDAGRIELDGAPVQINSPRDAIAEGVGMVHQTFLQVDSYTVTENIALGAPDIAALRTDLTATRRRIVGLSEQFGLAVDPDAVVEDLPVGIRQRVEILKALYRGSRVLVLDEPTTNLTPQEVDDLFRSVRAMVDEGMSVILITHKIRETLAVCDRMTVMREGSRVLTVDRGSTTQEQLAAVMVGRDTTDVAESEGALIATGLVAAATQDEAESPVVGRLSGAGAAFGARGLVVANDHGVAVIDGLDLSVASGEIVGIAGVAGNGQAELAEAISGVRALRAGSATLGDRELTGGTTADWMAAGVAYVPEDRHRDGILPTRSISENLLLGSHRERSLMQGPLISWRKARERAVEAIHKFSIQASGPNARAGQLSGGNIQRVVLARAFSSRPRLLVLHNPTRGLDIASTQFVYEQVHAATEAGCAVVLISEDLDEVIALSHRVLALYSGQILGEWSGADADRYEVGRAMTGLAKSDA